MVSSHCRPFTDITSTLNDGLSSFSPALSEGDAESDITDLPVTLQRSPSRLGFNFTLGDGSFGDVTQAEEKQARLKWTSSLFQSMDPDSSDFHEQVPLCVHLSSCSSSSSELGDESESDSDNSDEDDSPAGLIPFPMPTIQHQISSSHVSLANGPPARPPHVPCLSAVLSPLSPHHPGNQTPPASPQPPEINHHGLSRSALMHQKWFWSTRYEEWAIWEAQMEADSISHAYGGMAILPGTCPALSRDKFSSSRKIPPPSPCPTSVSPRIFPRLGDISALRDPYSVDIDRCFCRFPLWTVHKTLYMFDMHHRSTSLDRTTSKMTAGGFDLLSNHATTDEQADEVTSSADSSDSDLTLVSEDTSGSSEYKEKYLRTEDNIHESEEDSGGFRAWDGVRAWEISWYARWELLIELVKTDENKRNGLEYVGTSPREPPPMFFFAGEDGEEDDDDEDYGIIVSNPLFGKRV